MKQGISTVIGLLTFLLLATFGAAAYFVSQAYSAQKGLAVAVQFAEKQKEKLSELDRDIKRLEAEWQIAATESDNAMAQLEQFRGLIEDQDKEIEYLLENLQTVSNQLNSAAAAEQNLNQRIIQLDKEKRAAIEAATGFRDQLTALEKEFETVKNKKKIDDTPVAPPAAFGGLAADQVQARLKELEMLKAKKPVTPVVSPIVTQPTPVADISGTVREVNAKFGFAILDLGAPNGVKLGDEFAVSRANEPVGRLRVRKLHSGLSICDIISDKTSRAVLPGDRVEQIK